MNIREIQIDLHRDGNLHSTELVEYVNQRLDRRNTPSYRKSLFNIINRFLIASSEHCEKRIFHCHYHNEVEIENNDDIIEFSNFHICRYAFENYYFTCDVCEEVEHQDYRNRCDSRDYEYCETCYDERVRYCDDCDSSHDENDDCQCDERQNNLLSYNTRNKLYSHGSENAILFYGNEIEMQVYRDQSRYDIVEKFNDCFNYDGFENILCKRDGSLDADKGFEMSSTNCSFEYHKETFWNDFFELNPAQYCKGYDGYQCGIHWHFNRNVFTENQLRRLNCFYNHPKNKNLIVDIAGREGYQYCKFVPSITFDDPIRTIGDDFKYRVINFNNEHTIEIRIFRSNLKKISFFRYLEFVHSVNEWIRSSDQDNAENITWEYYFDWLLKNISRKFENLFFFLDDREHFDHLENIEEWKYVYTNFKTLITDFRNNNQEQIELESEEI
mgnify:CR=1 FL=1